MDFKDLQRSWNELGKMDPFWAILSDPSKKNNGWSEKEFFRTGEGEIKWVMDYMTSLPLTFTKRRALDFGCGVGRLTQPLCKYFEQCIGVDIAPSMIDLARKYNQYGDRCQYYVNQFDDLRMFDANYFDFIYSNIVLQHMEPRYGKKYIKEFVRILSIGGLAVFQIPSEPASTRKTHSGTGNPFAARITVAEPHLAANAGMKMKLLVKVTNLSTTTWPAEKEAAFPFHLGNHWLTADRQVFQIDDARAILQSEVKPSESIELSLTVTVPVVAGEYVLELDMVQEAVAWFKNRGSETALVNVTVKPSETHLERGIPPKVRPERMDPPDLEPWIEMYCTPRDVVVETVTSQGGKIVQIHAFESSGPEYVSYRYWISK